MIRQELVQKTVVFRIGPGHYLDKPEAAPGFIAADGQRRVDQRLEYVFQAWCVGAGFEFFQPGNPFSGQDIQPAPETVTADGADYIAGFARLDGDLVIILDINELLDPEQLDQFKPASVGQQESSA